MEVSKFKTWVMKIHTASQTLPLRLVITPKPMRKCKTSTDDILLQRSLLLWVLSF